MSAQGGNLPEDDRLVPMWAVVLPGDIEVLVRDLPFDLLSSIAQGSAKVESLADFVDQPTKGRRELDPKSGEVERRSTWDEAAKLYKAACKSRGLKAEPYTSLRDLKSRFRLSEGEAPKDRLTEILTEAYHDLEAEHGEVDAQALYAEVQRRLATQQWMVRLPDGTVVKLWDLEWALLEIVADRHGVSADSVLDAPLAGDGALLADLWASVTENQRQPATTDGMSYAEVVARFDVTVDDKPALPDMPAVAVGEDEFPEAVGPETD